ncbi:UDP-N-acetylmuramoyl-tripeptide--D-alanyl-D-alanine ligase [Sulfuritalea sp.]|uniref:UDP-N-acetylmuramoyl-tripeptide--D-alanyl-D- alanine ligase n=1 Tax=Sulfuritalea sp. TaxID=2480090 RepID=UPI001ACBAC86|nr:UDP-N-acetylmuramoyl-tripeptide--D-alanyl-D-alanine ligase [Sulfuritalea sp.]MBN8475873.1 UDP-N-acetylmuramoyl-tripeptide--D-alanyl-D-alanine ligase [Sulfuritalea sp.]
MMRLSEAGASFGVMHEGPDAEFHAVGTDSRAVIPGMLFVALKGERFDGHDYVREVLARGAAGAMVEGAWAEANPGLPLIPVNDTHLALGQLAAAWRGRFTIPLLGITGSNGKTTVKEMCAAILRAHFGGAAESVLATEGNLNNDIGLPLTLLKLRAKHHAAVIEMGMNHAGEIDYLTRLAAPTVALVNNAQRAHLEGLGTVQDVALAKGEIYVGLAPDGVAVFNADDAQADVWRELSRDRRQLRFGLDREAEVRGNFVPHGLGGELHLATPAGPLPVTLAVPGRHNARNACAAAAAALAAGATLDAVKQGLEAFAGVKGRLQRRVGREGALVVDDSYNANPDSMRAAIDVLATVPGKRIFVMGDMGEAGSAAAQFHDEIGCYAKSHGIDRLFCLGQLAAAAAYNFGAGGEHFERIEDLLKRLAGELDGATTILVKGSRFMKMERVVEAIVDPVPAAGLSHGGNHHQPERASPANIRHPLPREGGGGKVRNAS